MKSPPLFDRLRGITREIVATYDPSPKNAPHIHPQRRQPARAGGVRILENLFAVLYPGFYGVQHLTHGNVEYHVGALLDDIAADLYEQVVLAYELLEPGEELPVEGPAGGGWQDDRIPRLAERAVGRFLGRIPELRRLLVLDVQATMDGDPAARRVAEVIFAYPGFEAVTIQRLAHELWELGVPLLPRIMTEYAHSKTGIDLHPGAAIGESFFIDHGTAVVIGETAVIGKNVKIYQGVTLGALSTPRDPGGAPPRGAQRHPTLSDDVVVDSA